MKLSRLEGNFATLLSNLVPLYCDSLTQLQALGISEVQIHEPILVISGAEDLKDGITEIYKALTQMGLPRLRLKSTLNLYSNL